MKAITCEYTANGNKCPDENCVLDHTPVNNESEPESVVVTTQLKWIHNWRYRGRVYRRWDRSRD